MKRCTIPSAVKPARASIHHGIGTEMKNNTKYSVELIAGQPFSRSPEQLLMGTDNMVRERVNVAIQIHSGPKGKASQDG